MKRLTKPIIDALLICGWLGILATAGDPFLTLGLFGMTLGCVLISVD